MNESTTKGVNKFVTLADGTSLPAIGQGTWNIGENPNNQTDEIKALQLGVELGMSLIDTAEMYGHGASELLIGKAIEAIRQDVFLVSKVYPQNASKEGASKACENSLKRLKTDYLDLYLLHWRGSVPLEETVAAMEQLKKAGKIKRWGVSNFDIDDMQELWHLTNGQHCYVNQVLYNLGSRGIEFSLLPWCKQHNVSIMAYCPIAQGGSLTKKLLSNKVLSDLAKAKQCTIMQLLLAWCIRNGQVIAIPKAVNKQHIYENAQAASITLTEQELTLLDKEFNPPEHKMPLDIV